MSEIYRIKPLVWVDREGYSYARDGEWRYTVQSAQGGKWFGHGGLWETEDLDSRESAKAACEAHRLERLMPHLEPVGEGE